LEEEYEMCDTWRDDVAKYTFIVYDDDLTSSPAKTNAEAEAYVNSNLSKMVGDVNLFLSMDETVGDDGVTAVSSILQAEVEIMIAEPSARRKGIAFAAVQHMLSYGASSLGVRRFFVKISDDNAASTAMFKDKLGFKFVNYAECFKETEYEFTPPR
jgi:RimJ/RimL family protein N-acetyltransferase